MSFPSPNGNAAGARCSPRLAARSASKSTTCRRRSRSFALSGSSTPYPGQVRLPRVRSVCQNSCLTRAHPTEEQYLPRIAGAPCDQHICGLLAAVPPGGDVRALRVRLPRATQAAWIIGLTVPLTPLLNLMDARLRESGYIRIDETRVQVLNSDKAPSTLDVDQSRRTPTSADYLI